VPFAAAVDGDDTFTLFAAEPGHSFYRSLGTTPGLRIRGVAQHGGLGRILWALARAAASERVDALHVQYFAPLAYAGPVVVVVHDLSFLHVASSPLGLRLALRALVPWSVRRAAYVITPSEFTRRDLEARYGVPPERIRVTWYGVSERFRPLPETAIRAVLTRYGLEPGFIFSVGRLNRRKNLGTLFRAFALLRAQGRADLQLVLAGKVDYGVEELVRTFRESGRANRVHWVGAIPDDDLPAFYAGASCFVLSVALRGLRTAACGGHGMRVSGRQLQPNGVSGGRRHRRAARRSRRRGGNR
jgi:glycosyltransferase involved in cell wall biosynthesis